MVSAEQKDIFVAKLLHQFIEIKFCIILESFTLFKLVVAPGRCVQDHFLVFQHSDLFLDAFDIFVGKFKERIVSRITGFQNDIFFMILIETERRNHLFAVKTGWRDEIIHLASLDIIFFVHFCQRLSRIHLKLDIISETL